MRKHPKIAVIGGTGKAGRYLVKELLNQGYSIRLLLRNPEKYPYVPDSVEVVAGDARSYTTIKKLVEGCGAVISTLGQPVGEPTIFSEATTHVLRVMEEEKVRRYIQLTGLHVATPEDCASPWVVAATTWMQEHYPFTTADKQVEYQLLAQSTVDWTLVRLPMILLTDDLPASKVSLHDCPSKEISAASLARFLVQELSAGAYIRKAPFVANSL